MNKRISLTLLILTIALNLIITLPAESAEIGQPAPEFTLTSALGNQHSLADYRGKLVVLEWYNPGCPFVMKYYDSGQMQKLQQEYTQKGVVWLIINSSAQGKQGHCPPDVAQKLIREKKIMATEFLLDHNGQVGLSYQAKTTPHMYVIDQKGILAYQGAIDDKASTSIADLAQARNHVKEALEEIMAGQSVSVKTTKPYGCSVKY